jgi:hypothetical protein
MIAEYFNAYTSDTSDWFVWEMARQEINNPNKKRLIFFIVLIKCFLMGRQIAMQGA